MGSQKGVSRAVGALFLTATIAFMLGDGIIASNRTGSDLLATFDANATRILVGVLLQLAAACANVCIGVLLFTTLSRHSPTIALGYLVTRIFDGLGIAIVGVSSLMLLALGQAVARDGTQATEQVLLLSHLLTSGGRSVFIVTMITLGFGGMPFCYLLYRTKLIPRALAALGSVGYFSLFAGSAFELFGWDLQMLHYVPGGIFEAVLPLWLFVNGFAHVSPESNVSASTNEALDPLNFEPAVSDLQR